MGRLLNGTTGYLSRSNKEELQPQAQSYAIALRFKRTSGSAPGASQILASRGNVSTGSTGFTAGIRVTSGEVYFRVSDGTNQRGIQSVGRAILDTDWHSLVCVIDRVTGTVRAWLDGSESGFAAGGPDATSEDISGLGSLTGSLSLTFGAYSTPGFFFDGALADLAIVRGSVPTAGQIAAYHAGVCAAQSLMSPWLVAAWPLVGDSLVNVAHTAFTWTLTSNGTTTPTAWLEPEITWNTDPDTVWDTDDFVASDNTLLENHTSDQGRAWVKNATFSSGQLRIVGNKVIRTTDNPFTSGYALPTSVSRTMRARVTYRQKSVSGTSASGLFINQDVSSTDHALWCGYLTANNTLRIVRTIGSATNLCSTGATLSDDTDYQFDFERSGNRLVFAVDNKLAGVARFNNSQLINSQCRVGLRIGGGADSAGNGVQFSNLQVWRGPESHIIDRGTAGGASVSYTSLHVAAVAETASNYVIFAEERLGTGADDNIAQIVQYTAAKSNIASWTKATTVATADAIRHNPVPFGAGTNDLTLLYVALPAELHGTSTNVTAHVIQSSNGGASWGSPVDVTSSVAKSPYTRGLIVGPGRGLVTSTGRFLTIASGRDGVSDPRFAWPIWSDDGGSTWSQGAVITGATGLNEGSMFQVGSRIYLQIRSNNAGSPGADRFSGRLLSYSDDNGATWAEATRRSEVPSPYASDWEDSIHAGYTVFNGAHILTVPCHQWRQRLGFYSSSNEGATWTGPFTQPGRISGGRILEFGNAAYSSLLPVAGGLLVVYSGGLLYDRSKAASNWQQSLYVSLVESSWLGGGGDSGRAILGKWAHTIAVMPRMRMR